MLHQALVLALVAGTVAVRPPSDVCERAAHWPTYHGAFFSIQYPPDFEVHPSLPNGDGFGGHDSAFFRSPDGAVEFYVFSPQWDGEPTAIKVKPETENLVDEKTKIREIFYPPDDVPAAYSRATWVTIEAKDKSYTRSYLDIRGSWDDTGPQASVWSRRTFGIKYVDQRAYRQYRDQYLRFRSTLRQFADA